MSARKLASLGGSRRGERVDGRDYVTGCGQLERALTHWPRPFARASVGRNIRNPGVT